MDRNREFKIPLLDVKPSLSARRAWIEICTMTTSDRNACVALRKESVDRNMRWVAARINTIAVALRKESVDRNLLRTPT